MICKNCGTKNINSNSFCSKCGNKMDYEKTHSINEDYGDNKEGRINNKSNKARLIIPIFAVFLFVVLIAVIKLFFLDDITGTLLTEKVINENIKPQLDEKEVNSTDNDMSTLFWTTFFRTIYLNSYEFTCNCKIAPLI